ncbi:hypothetical protein [Phenylobacterium sp.]|uniref:hypothetical protein n=1 Tax=Phenylobacterium sp. TaxID=1871053 RepID=UPI003BAD41EA
MSGESSEPATSRARHELGQISESDYINPSPERQAELSAEIDRYYNTPLDMFPFSEHARKPDRFYDFYEASIDERFPGDRDIRDVISRYGRAFFGSLVGYVAAKRVLLALALFCLWLMAVEGPAMVAGMGLGGLAQVAAILATMLLILPVYAGINALVFQQYRISLENRSYELSRLIVQRTRELQNLYTTLRALPDQEETRHVNAGKAWGARSAYLVRLMMWVAQRMEYLEKFIQVEMWRVRRERYWINWAGGILVVLILAAWIALLVLQTGQTIAAAPWAFRLFQGVALVLGLGLAWASYHFWKTPLNLARDKLGSEAWIRYATLDLDNTIGDQISRDKERLVEYLNLNKGR